MLVRALAGQHDFVAVFKGEFAEGELANEVEVGVVVFRVVGSVFEAFGKLSLVHVLLHELDFQVFGRAVGDGRLIEAGCFVEGNAEAAHFLASRCGAHGGVFFIDQVGDHASDDGRVDATGEVDADGDISPEAQLDRFKHALPHTFDHLLRGPGVHGVLVRVLGVPVLPLLDATGDCAHHVVTGSDVLDVFEDGTLVVVPARVH